MAMHPTFEGYVQQTQDALLLFQAVIDGRLPRIARRLHDRERAELIRSGAVFIFNEHASGIKRWTDGVSWSPSRILGNFLVYRQLEKPFTAGVRRINARRSRRRSYPYQRCGEGVSPTTANSMLRSRSQNAEFSLVGSLVDSDKFKKDGLVKKTISVPYKSSIYHLISYYCPADVLNGLLKTPSQCPELTNIRICDELANTKNLRAPMDVTVAQLEISQPFDHSDGLAQVVNSSLYYPNLDSLQIPRAPGQPPQIMSMYGYSSYNPVIEMGGHLQPYNQPNYPDAIVIDSQLTNIPGNNGPVVRDYDPHFDNSMAPLNAYSNSYSESVTERSNVSNSLHYASNAATNPAASASSGMPSLNFGQGFTRNQETSDNNNPSELSQTSITSSTTPTPRTPATPRPATSAKLENGSGQQESTRPQPFENQTMYPEQPGQYRLLANPTVYSFDSHQRERQS